MACGDENMDTLKKQLIVNISELLVKQGLLSVEENNRVKVAVNNQSK